MNENFTNDEQIPPRPIRRTTRSSTLKPKVIVENVIKEEERPIAPEPEEEIDTEDPPELYRVGDIVWHRVPGNPWWPALVYGCHYEDNLYTKVNKSPRMRKRRIYFVYFFGPNFEYAWTNGNPIVLYEGLDEFIRHAEQTVAKAPSKNEQEFLANRFEMKVSGKQRPQWDEAIAQANEAFKLSHEQRAANFAKILRAILYQAEVKVSRKRHSSVSGRQSRKTSSSSSEQSSHRSSVKRQKTKSTPSTTSTSLLHVGLPTLTVHDEQRIVNELLSQDQLNLHDAQSMACHLVTNIVKEKSHIEMTCVQIEWFYDLLINNPEIVSKYRHWFAGKIEPVMRDSIYFKQCQLKSFLDNQSK